jgi:hypothetical protein
MQCLLQSETVQDGSDQVGFFGRCLQHGSGGKDMVDGTPAEVKDSQPVTARETCARTEVIFQAVCALNLHKK